MHEDFDILNDEDYKEIDEYLENVAGKSVNQKMKNMYVGYIDINGMQYMMSTMKEDEFEDLCNNIATMVDSILEENRSYAEDINISKTIEFHMFSDNMIFLCEDLQFLIERMGLIQRRLVVQLQLTIKGGIDYGSVYYYRNRFILGKGLVSAYKIDADYHNPAIQINRKLVSNDLKGILKVGFDEYVVDYYRIAAALSEDFWFEEVEYIKKLIINNISKATSEDVVHKYMWLKEYHNAICKKEGREEFIIK